MDHMFRRWVKLPTVLALLRPTSYENIVLVRFFTEDEATKKHYPWLEKCITFELNSTAYGNSELANIAENFVAKTITIDKAYFSDTNTNDCYLIEIKENQ